ncbi:MAG: helix-turn-helix domain-containing protein [Syntrophorhabdales bacterium]
MAHREGGSHNVIRPRWLSLSHASKYACMHRQTLMRYVMAGEIYGTLKGGKWYLDKDSIDSFFLEDKIVIEKCLSG